MKEFGQAETVGTNEPFKVKYARVFNDLVRKKLSEPVVTRKRGPKLYQQVGFFSQYLCSGLEFIFQEDLRGGDLYFTVQESASGRSHEFGVKGEDLIRRSYLSYDVDLSLDEAIERRLTSEESAELMEVMRDPKRFAPDTLPRIVSLKPEEAQLVTAPTRA